MKMNAGLLIALAGGAAIGVYLLTKKDAEPSPENRLPRPPGPGPGERTVEPTEARPGLPPPPPIPATALMTEDQFKALLDMLGTSGKLHTSASGQRMGCIRYQDWVLGGPAMPSSPEWVAIDGEQWACFPLGLNAEMSPA